MHELHNLPSDPLPRLASRRLEAILQAMPVAVVMGARQTGKSTLTQITPATRDREYLTLDDYDVLAQARESPGDLVRRSPRLVIDEVQREPDLLLAVKRQVDSDRPRQMGRFVLTGSANLLLLGKVSETLAGRAGYVTLWPMTRRERLGIGEAGIWSDLLDQPVATWDQLIREERAPAEDWSDVVVRGGFPTPALELDSIDACRIWFDGYVQTYLERDLQTLASIDNLVDFRRLMRAACLRLGGVINQAELGRDTGISRPTAHRYLNLLEASYQIVRVEPYAVNRTKRLVKSPKLYAGDVGLALHLSGAQPGGPHLENLILSDLLAWRDGARPQAQVLYWRTVEGAEVDFVIEDGARLLPVEVKASSRVVPSDARHVRTFMDQYGSEARGGLVLYNGESTFWLSEGILAAPWWRVI